MDSDKQTGFDTNSAEMVDMYDELPLWAAPFGMELLRQISIKSGVTALDIGFGTGFPLTELAMRLGSSSKVYGVDPWEAATRRVKRKINYYGISNIELITGVVENLPLDDATIDLIVSNNGVNNVNDMHKALLECARVAKKDAQLVFTMNLNTSMHELFKIFRESLAHLGIVECEDNISELVYKKRKPISEVERLLQNTGFHNLNMTKHEFDYRFADAQAMFDHYFMRLAFIDDWQKIVPVDVRPEFIRVVKQLVNTISKKEGFFKLTIPFVVISCNKI